MDIEKAVKFAETYLRDYVVSVFSILIMPRSSFGPEGTAEAVLTVDNSRTWIYAMISMLIGLLAFGSAVSRHADSAAQISAQVSIVSVIFTMWLWLVFAVLAHLLTRALKGSGNVMTTLSVCLRILPTVYAVGSLCALTIAWFLGELLADLTGQIPGDIVVMSFLLFQFAMLAFYLPASLCRAHKIGIGPQAIFTLTLPAIVFCVNLFALVGSCQAVM